MKLDRTMLNCGFGMLFPLFLLGCNNIKKEESEYTFIKPGDKAVTYQGRAKKLNTDSVLLAWSGTQITLTFEADTLWAHFGDVDPDSVSGAFTANHFNVMLDDNL